MCLVDPSSGRLTLVEQDFSLEGPIPLTLERSYRSSNVTRSDIGHGWTHSFAVRLWRDEPGSALVFSDSDGRRIPLPSPPDGTPVHNSFERVSVSRVPARLLVWPELVDLADGALAVDMTGLPTLLFDARSFGTLLPLRGLADRNGNLVAVYPGPDGLPARIEAPFGRALHFIRDGRGFITRASLVSRPTSGTSMPVVDYTIDDRGDLVQVRDAAGVRRYAYDHEHRLVGHRDRLGGHCLSEYDRAGRCVRSSGPVGTRERTYEFDPGACRTVVRDSRGFSTIFEYNEAEQIVRTVDREGGASTFDYDSEGRLVCTTNQLGGETMIIFDGRGAPAGKVRPDGSAVAVETDAAALVKSIVLPTGAAVKYERDEFGRVVRIARPGRGTVEYTYDARGDVTRFKTPFGKEARLVWSDDRRLFTEADDIGILTQQEVDALGRVVSFEDAVGAVTRFAYDAAGRIAEMRHPDGTQRRFQWDAEGHLTVLIDEANRKTSWAYDSAGRCVEAVVPNGQAVRSTYDTEDRLVSVEEPTGSAHRFAYTPRGLLAHYDTPDGRRIAFRHDPVGNIVEMIDPDGGSTRVRRDPVGRIEHAWYPEGGEKTIALDEGGRWIRIEHGGHVLERELTPDGLVVRERQDDFLLAREFGDAGELRAVTDGSGNRIAYAYDVDGRVRQAQITRGEWAKGQWTATGPPRTHRFDYDRVGSLVRWTLPSGLAEHRRYDLRRRLVEQVVMHGMQAIARRAYEYDATGRCVAIADSIRGRRDFGLDLLGRLERIAENGSERRFIYDASGHEVGGAHYDAQHRLRTAGSWRYEYDSRGFVVRRVHPHGSVEYEWTPQGLLNTARLSDGRSVHFEYDPHQRLVAKRVDGVTTRYFWNEEQLWAIREGNQPVTLFGWLPRAYAPFEGRRGERSWSVHVDHIGKIQEFLDAEGDVHWQAPSGPWGEGRADSGVDCPFGFPGQIWDSATRLYYHRYRFYDPECGRFLTPDPVGIHGGLDPYRYVADPVNLFDPDGLACRGKTDDPTLYRGDSRPPSEICAQGFQPTGPTENISLLDHVGGRSPSNWVSTSYEGADAERAAHWGVTSPKAPPNAEPWVYVIDNPGCGVEVDCDPDIQKRQDDLKKMGVPPEESEHEIAFNGGLPANRVLGYYHADLGPSSFQACP